MTSSKKNHLTPLVVTTYDFGNSFSTFSLKYSLPREFGGLVKVVVIFTTETVQQRRLPYIVLHIPIGYFIRSAFFFFIKLGLS